MKAKILSITLTALAIAGAFLIGKLTTPRVIITQNPTNLIQLEKAIPLDDVACWYIDEYDYITVELKDVTHQLDSYQNASYIDVLKDIPKENK